MKKVAAAASSALTATVEKRLGLQTYSRPDGAVMVEIGPHSFLSAELLWLVSGTRPSRQ